MRALANLPLALHLTGVAGLAMMLPAAHALVAEDFHVARSFFYSGLLTLIITAFIGIAVNQRHGVFSQREQLATLVAAFTLLPLVLAVPLYEGSRNTTFLNAYFEMVSSLTTTGASLYEGTGQLTKSLHLWRGIVGWLGGLLIWVVAAATLAPMNLGGFEITTAAGGGEDVTLIRRGTRQRTPAGHIWYALSTLAPIYISLTLLLWVLLLVVGEDTLRGLMHAMGTMSTSGITIVGHVTDDNAGLAAEVVILFFFAFGISRLTFSRDVAGRRERLLTDPEVQMAGIIIIGLPMLLFLRHWIGAIEVNEYSDFTAGLLALWGSVFTVASFLTTTGYESVAWNEARDWSGLPAPGVVLIGLSIIGGGVATTTGGVKLLRVYALYKHGVRELNKLVYPSSVAGMRAYGRRIHRQGAFLAWLFFMLFALSIAAVMSLLTAFGVGFEEAMIFAVAGLSTTGQLAHAGADVPLTYASLSDGAKLVVCFAMVLGRLEALALIALFNPNFWRN